MIFAIYACRHTVQCFIYNKDKGWSQLSKMNQGRYGGASMPIDGGMIIIGGYNEYEDILKSSQIVFANGSITEGPELPEPISGHCLAYDKKDDVFFVTGGVRGDRSKAWKFNNPNKFKLNGTTQMNMKRDDHSCGIVRSQNHDRRPLLVVAGGKRNQCVALKPP